MRDERSSATQIGRVRRASAWRRRRRASGRSRQRAGTCGSARSCAIEIRLIAPGESRRSPSRLDDLLTARRPVASRRGKRTRRRPARRRCAPADMRRLDDICSPMRSRRSAGDHARPPTPRRRRRKTPTTPAARGSSPMEFAGRLDEARPRLAAATLFGRDRAAFRPLVSWRRCGARAIGGGDGRGGCGRFAARSCLSALLAPAMQRQRLGQA